MSRFATIGFNSMLRDDDVRDKNALIPAEEGLGNSYSTEFRGYDPRNGRWLSIDPLASKFPWSSPYVAMGNNPVIMVDPRGDSTFIYGDNTSGIVNDLSFRFPELSITSSLVGNANLINIRAKEDYHGEISLAGITLIEASANPLINVNLFSMSGVEQAYDKNNTVKYISVGMYGGNFPSLNNSTIKEGLQYINYQLSKEFERVGLAIIGEIPAHEIIESYLSAKNRIGLIEAHNSTLNILPSIELQERTEENRGIVRYYYSIYSDTPTWHLLQTRNMNELEKPSYKDHNTMLNLIKKRGE